MNTKNNKRFYDTEIRMNVTLLALMQKYPFEKITVRMICQETNINRSTFYAHYMDLYDMLDKMSVRLLEMLYAEIDGMERRGNMGRAVMTLFLSHIEQHKYFYSVFFHSRKELPLAKAYDDFWENIVLPYGKKAGVTETEAYYYFLCMKAAFNAILVHWVERDCAEDKQKITDMMMEYISQFLKKQAQ
ncbi:MAG: TetR-like C-terminal domain-containing protein [Clostridia bacterium]|nr:TetR-like C-terminal domain-containing protein [Clostridia bacterium]